MPLTKIDRWIVSGAFAFLLFVWPLPAQDGSFVRAWTEAQRARPRSVASVARIAPRNEPGTPLLVKGRVYQRDGRTPAPGVIVFAYHTDSRGLYHNPGVEGWRLRGWAQTDSDGRFEFQTIRPGSYPGSRAPAHIHLTIEGPGLTRRWAQELNFADDPFVSGSQKERSAEAGPFGSVREVRTRNGVQAVEFNIRIADGGRF